MPFSRRVHIILGLSIVVLATVFQLWANDNPTRVPLSQFKPVTEAFLPGEHLEYQVSWLGIKAGKSYMSVDVPEKLGDIVESDNGTGEFVTHVQHPLNMDGVISESFVCV